MALFDGRDFVGEGKRNFLESFSDYDDTSSCGSKRLRSHDQDEDDWTLDIHRDFVSVIFSTGLHICSPSVILENMILKTDQVNSERVKSRLQKVRMKPERARDEFLAAYDLALMKFYKAMAMDEFSIGPRRRPDIELIAKFIQAPGTGYLLHAEPAAYLTVSSMHSDLGDTSTTRNEYPSSMINELKMNPIDFLDRNTSIEFPILTEDEKKTPLGALFCYIMGTFITLKQYIRDNRKKERLYNPGEICKHDMKFPPLVLSSNQNIFQTTTNEPSSKSMMDIETIKNNYYVYEPPLSSLKRNDSI